MNKLSLVGMQLPENIGEFQAKALRLDSRVTLTPEKGSSFKTSKFSYIFSGSCISTNENQI
jgi:hypothetical protein